MDAKIEVKRSATVTAEIPGVTIVAEVDDDGHRIVGKVQVEFAEGLIDRHTSTLVDLDPGTLERIGALLGKVRREIGDTNEVCVVHAYFAYDRARERPWECPACEAQKVAEKAATSPVVVAMNRLGESILGAAAAGTTERGGE